MSAGLRCAECGSYNTVRDKGPLTRRPSASPPPPDPASITPPLSPSAPSASGSAPIPAVLTSTASASFTMTPEPSPMRLEAALISPRFVKITAANLLLIHLLRPELNLSSVARRISFSEQEEAEEDITE